LIFFIVETGRSVSITMAAESGSESLVKKVNFCGFPSSYTVKSCQLRPGTSRPELFFTITGSTTKLV